MSFKAFVVNKDEAGVSQEIKDLEISDLPEAEVLVSVDYSTLNYKDGLCINATGGLVRKFPHVPGIDFAGTVETSSDNRYKPGDKVVLTGWRVGEAHWGGYAQKASVRADWLVPLPDSLSTHDAMAVGTAGFTAVQAIVTLEEAGMTPGHGEILVTGAAGGVGSVAVATLAKLGYEVAAVTGRPEAADELKALGATTIIDRAELTEPSTKPLEGERWAGCIDAVGGEMLGRVQKQMKYGCSIAAIGLAGGAAVPSFTVIPYLLRGVNLLGIDSVMCPYEKRLRIWERVARDLPLDKFRPMISDMTMADLPQLGKAILKGQVKGRVVIDVNA